MIFNEIVEAIKSVNSVAIVGAPASGKTMLSNRLNIALNNQHNINWIPVYTDDFRHHNWEDAINLAYELCKRIKAKGNLLLEGIQAAKILHRGIENDDFNVDLIIKFDLPNNILASFYHQRTGYNNYPIATQKAINTIFNEYWAKTIQKPLLIEIKDPIQYL